MTKLSRSEARLRRHKRVRKFISGSAECPRLAIYRSLAEIYAQVIDDGAGQTLAAASSVDQELRKSLSGKTKSEQARMVGELIAKRAQEKGIKKVVFDRGGFKYIGRVKSLADGARESGLDF
jgi:large subunit ribosomal protein L18